MTEITIKEFESQNIKLDSSDINFLKKFHKGHLKIRQVNEFCEIKASSFIGLIILPSKTKITIKPKIKIDNLLYLISYAFNLVSFKNKMHHELSENNSLIDIYIVVFLNWLDVLINKGLGKQYQIECDKIPTIKGKIRISENLIKKDRIFCEFDELTFSTKENQILKATLRFIMRMKITGPKIQQRTVNYYRFLSEINNIELSDSVFSSIVYNKLNFHYKPLIELCKLIYESCRLTDNRGNNIFSGFIANMNLVFEKFILKSLQQIMPQETIHASLKNDWAIPTEKFLPEIKPDILVRNRAIIDVKYYKSPFTQKDKFITGHIFQIVFYLNAYKLRKGILVYPQPEDVDDIISKSYFIDENNFQIFCIPLNRNISDIENSIFELKSILMN